MRSKYLIITLILASSFFIYNCSEIEDEIAKPEELEGVHPEGFGQLGSNKFHSFKIQDDNWDLENCQKCHASDYSGGPSGVSCLGCHAGSAGPEACNTCHGVFADENRIAPPTDLNNNFETSARGVGAHTVHIYENKLSLGIGCFECHAGDVVEGNYVKAHIDGLPAEMQFGDFAASGLSQPTYNADLSCANTYCHGNFEFGDIKGSNFSPVWNIVDGTQAACGTCHGKVNDGELIPTPEGHFGNFEADACIGCHATAYNEDGTLNKFTHINGEPNFN
jgi:predicted CxxxxCH...CXXCH cytochrome family protein